MLMDRIVMDKYVRICFPQKLADFPRDTSRFLSQISADFLRDYLKSLCESVAFLCYSVYNILNNCFTESHGENTELHFAYAEASAQA